MYIGELMTESGVKFGTSGARGRVADMTDRICYAYATGFLHYLLGRGQIRRGDAVGIAGDLRPSTVRIMTACARATADLGLAPRNFGLIPTPALAAYGIANAMPTMMVTGSHIPDDRNGIKFNLPAGEILKDDEAEIRAQHVALPPGLFDADGSFAADAAPTPRLPAEERDAYDAYVARYRDFYPADALAGLRIGLYEHSSVARDVLHAILTGLGAEVERLGFSDSFVPVDTEAIRPEDVKLARQWAADGRFDALVSTDGDGDRPLLADERGEWMRGDIAGILCARALGAAGVVTPISSNTALERSGWFRHCLRTRIGSPYVIAGMQTLSARGITPVVGYEANGGFLLDSEIERAGRRLTALPTRDAAIVIAAVLGDARASGRRVSELSADLPMRFTHSDRIEAFPPELSAERLAAFDSGDEAADRRALDAVFARHFGPVAGLDRTDGLRIRFESGEIAHLRPSGNAPELRAYTESTTAERAREMNDLCLEILRGWLEQRA
ncbi:MAG: phosphomannomutase [Thiohalocapsa sp.]|jgi:phosphomannomutase